MHTLNRNRVASLHQAPATPQSHVALSVIVPVYNEEDSLPGFLDAAAQWDCVSELIFVDGGSTDATLSMLTGLKVIQAQKGRGLQCRLGAKNATGDAFVFVHADSIVPAASMRAVYRALASGTRWGCLKLRFTTNTPDRIAGHVMANARVRLTGIPFGDQTMFVTRELYNEVGGMPNVPIMEDYELARRLRSVCWPKQLDAMVYTSPRRFESGGNMRTMVQMRYLRHLYRKGVPAEVIAHKYGEGRHIHG